MRAALYRAATLLAVTPLAAQTSPTWRYTATAPISFFSVTPLGSVVVATTDGLMSLDPDSGTVIWKRDDLRDLEPASYGAIRQSPFATVQLGERFELIDLVTGATKWSTPPSADLEPYLPMPELGLFLAYGSNDSLKHVIVAFDLETGVVRWERVQPFDIVPGGLRTRRPGIRPALPVARWRDSTGPQPARWISDSAFLLYIPGHGPVLMHAGTGEWLWGADKLEGWKPPLLEVPAWFRSSARMLLSDSVVYVPFENRLQALRIRDGARLWVEAHRFPAPITQLELTARGLVVGSLGSSLDLIDPATGAARWRKRFRNVLQQPRPVTPSLVEEGRVWVAANGKLLAISLDDGATTEVARFKFDGDEHPFVLERREKGLLLIGSQNLMLLDSAGALVYHVYHPAPGRGTLSELGLGAVAVVSTVVNVVSDVAYCAFDDDCTWAQPVEPNLFLPVDRMPVPSLGKRYVASEQARNHVYSVAQERDSIGHRRPAFLRLHKDDGRMVGRVWLEEKRPKYALDLISGMLYAKNGDREILAFRF